MPTIKLKSSDEVIFEVDIDVMGCSVLFNTMLEDLGVDDQDDMDNNDAPIVLPFDYVTLSKASHYNVIDWGRHHQKDDSSSNKKEYDDDDDDDYEVNLTPWEINFFKVNEDILLQLLEAANYLHIEPLLNAACKTVANWISGKTATEIRGTFNIKNDFTPDEEEDIQKEYEWLDSVTLKYK